MPENTASPIIAQRYQLLNEIGSGGMGRVYRALDRLTGQVVALKQVIVASYDLLFASRADNTLDVRLALAHEFKTLASLRHPNIVSVIDYGFDAQRQPFFTMTLLEGAQTIIEAGHNQPPDVQYGLLTQLLQALLYLHRRGILHRDLKPGNVMVVNGQVKVLDFGLSVAHGEGGGTSGTLAYMAPELFADSLASEASDLYAFGTLAYELLAGKHPFRLERIDLLIEDILKHEPDLTALHQGKELTVLIEQLLAKEPQLRNGDAARVLTELSAATGRQIPTETALTRESFLQAARLVGREAELKQLSDALATTLKGNGAQWLVGGESGIGKSRLLDELRTLALVEGALVLRGQAISESGAPYLVWRDALRQLCLQTELSDPEKSILKALVPDIGTLLGSVVPDAPELDPQATQERLLTVICDVFARQKEPVLAIIEDMQWAGSESVAVFKRLGQQVAQHPLMLVASYRSDEHPDLPADLPGAQALALTRLPKERIEDLCVSILGEKTGRKSELTELLNRETEGNIFFVVEVLRALAEESGQLDRIGTTTLPAHVFSGGMKTIVQRRLGRIPADANPLLEIAAVIGRILELKLLAQISPTINLESWLATCNEAALLEVKEGQWYFAHDKLREGLLLTLEPEPRRLLHERVAIAMEQSEPDPTNRAAALAYHWNMAGNTAKELHYAILATDAATKLGAYTDARTYYIQALGALAKLPDSIENRRLRVDLIFKHSLMTVGKDDPAEHFARLTEAKTIAEALPGSDGTPGDRPRLARANYWFGYSHYYRGAMPEAIGFFRQVLASAQDLDDPDLLVLPSVAIGRVLYLQGRWRQAAPLLEQGLVQLKKKGNLNEWYENAPALGYVHAVSGKYLSGIAEIQHALEYSLETNDLTKVTVCYLNLAGVYVQADEYELARQASRSAVDYGQRIGNQVLTYIGYGYLIWTDSWLKDHEALAVDLPAAKTLAASLGTNVALLELFAASEVENAFSLGHISEALALAQPAVELAKARNSLIAQSVAHQAWARALVANDKLSWPEAEQHLKDSQALLEECGGELNTAFLHRIWGELSQAVGDQRLANEHLDKAALKYAEMGMTKQLEQVKKLVSVAK